MKRFAFALAALLVVAVGIGVASATIPSSGGKIFGCYAKNGGALRVVAAGQKCKSGEQPLFWNQEGPAGPAGPQGPKGDRGPQGPAGSGLGKLTQRESTRRLFGGTQPVEVDCAPGERVTGGGVDVGNPDPALHFLVSRPAQDRQGWLVVVQNDTGIGVLVSAFAVCAA